MPSKVYSAAVVGIDAHIVEIETEVSYGLRTFDVVGLADQAISEAKERIGVALKNAGYKSPRTQPMKVLVSLAPADVKKEGSLYDLPIAIGFLVASKQLLCSLEGKLIFGELSLDGRLRPIRGALAFAILAAEMKYKEIILPKENAKEASLVLSETGNTLQIFGAESLQEVILHLNGTEPLSPFSHKQDAEDESQADFPLSLIRGQESAKRALEITAAGGHNILMQGPPGTGKTLLAKALASLLPPLQLSESLEITRIYSISGLLSPEKPRITRAPFRSPHHSSSEVALIGGGNPPRAGEITFAHKGVLFLDEFPEFHRDSLESLRGPLEEGEISLLRARHHLSLPARFMFVAAANPCPCGYYRDPERECVCTPSAVQKYKRKLSGPLMDRIDIFVDVPQIKYEELTSKGEENRATEKARQKNIEAAREIQRKRFGREKTNAQIDLAEIKKYCQVDGQSDVLLKQYVDSGRLSARGFHRILKLGRTIADLENSGAILFSHISEALSYRLREEV